ncbi:TRAP transporter large permease [Sedimentibacter hydroxybenzoicus DSM 7310]|uniref:TRAP transporter large permease n=1 Tax=Sedimentibacter hydroxybenzoicus DSM 7310 TaxID=1123245 RepID=A0A974GXM6_SEDHY|nr:TRAP transporter large permease [Sedimentibacter hydroxybenzoicus]NYB75757.1 TRAP transporter large permease [Sedimentibacter hydroxybenzoicus DSM 7310]
MGIILIILILVFAIIGIPIAFSLGISSLVTIIAEGYPLVVVPQKLFGGIDSFPLLAIPFFILSGELMNGGGLNKRIIRVANAFLGNLPGSLPIITIVASAFFAAISGSAVATVAAIGGITIPAMIKQGYPDHYAAGVASSASIVGPIIPPSITLIVYGSSLQLSISSLFLASAVPGIFMTFAFILIAVYQARKNNYPREGKTSFKEKFDAVKEGFWALMMPVIILGGIFSGTFTPTEAAVVSVVYAFIIGLFVYKGFTLKDLPKILGEAAVSASTIMLILATSKILAWVITVINLPTMVANAILGITDNAFLILMLVNIILLIVGCLMEANAAVIILIPILVPIVTQLGMSPITFGVLMTVNLCLGLLTPPVGICLLLGSQMAGSKFEKAVISMLPYFAVGLITLMLTTFVPAITLWLPGLM